MRLPVCAALAALALAQTTFSRTLEAAPPPGSTTHPDSVTSGLLALATPARGSSGAADDLGPTSDPPWNPPRAMSRRRTWENVILFPQRLATYPLSWVGMGLDRGLLWVESTALPTKIIYVTKVLPDRTGFSIKQAQLGDRTGLGGRIEAHAPFLAQQFKSLVSVSHQASTRNYHRTQVRSSGRKYPFLEYGYEWRPQEQFYGIGMGAVEDSLTDYASQFEWVIGNLSYGWNRDEENTRPRTTIAGWMGPRAMVTRTGREDGRPSIEQVFPAEVATTLDRRFEHFVFGARLSTDWRVGEPHWSGGWRVLLQGERYDKPRGAFALHSARDHGAQFTRTTIEFETGTSFMRDPRTLRLFGRLVDQGISSRADRMMVADLASLGGRQGLYGFQPGRFHDTDLVLARLSYVFPLQRRFEIDLHAESGGVFPDVWKATRIASFEQSFGVALRGRTHGHPLGAIGVDWSRESMRLRYSLGNPD